MKQNDNPPLSKETLAAQALGNVDPITRAIVPPLHPSTTFLRDEDGAYSSGHSYTRSQNPTYDAPETLLANLESGSSCRLFASGMAAAIAVFQSLNPGDRILAPRVMYWGLRKWLFDFAVPWGLTVDLVDTYDLTALAAALDAKKTRLVWLETPANPTWEISDIAAVCKLAHKGGVVVAVDNTVASPVITRPIELGADLVMHSATKYLNGHSDVLAGALITAKDDDLWQRICNWQSSAGGVLGTFETWLLLRGMRTLYPRVKLSSESALKIALYFENHPRVYKVLYPGLESHPQHKLAKQQMQHGFSGMLSMQFKDGEPAAVAIAARTRVFKRATSLGGVESLIEHRATIEGADTPVPFDLLRLSVGLENVDDLIADLDQALGYTADDLNGITIKRLKK